jgi:hypothetical protein
VWQALVRLRLPTAEWNAQLVAAAGDPSPRVRAIVAGQISDGDVLERLANHDDDGDVRTQALVHLAALRGREASTPLLLDKIAGAPPATADRVRAALAWHLAR